LAQLHQLRGRVGRGAEASVCLLLYQGPLGETARARLNVLRETDDGFRIAEEDLRLRGAGELLGVRQSGLPAFRIADLATHGELLAMARDDAALMVAKDPELATPRGQAVRVLLYLFERDAAARTVRSG
jgi:ATP-dependent DNA helicase RecG